MRTLISPIKNGTGTEPVQAIFTNLSSPGMPRQRRGKSGGRETKLHGNRRNFSIQFFCENRKSCSSETKPRRHQKPNRAGILPLARCEMWDWDRSAFKIAMNGGRIGRRV